MKHKSAKELLSSYSVDRLEKIFTEELDAIGISHTDDLLGNDSPLTKLSYDDLKYVTVCNFEYYENGSVIKECSAVIDNEVKSNSETIYDDSFLQNYTFRYYSKSYPTGNPLNAA